MAENDIKGRGQFIPHDEVFDGLPEIDDLDINISNPSEVGNMLHIQKDINIDPKIEVKSRSVDTFIRDLITDETMRNSQSAFKNVFERVVESMGVSLIAEIRAGKAINVLDRLFQEASIRNGLSSDTFLEQMGKKVKEAKIKSLKSQLKELLK